jgi:NAD(P)-dependent dehydrogenase (short-subunit alcohol dehydrogenase family)
MSGGEDMADLSLFDLTGKVAIVTGGGWGISKAVALGFAQAGAHVAVVDKMPERAAATAAAIEDLDRLSIHSTAHIGYENEANAFVDSVLEKFGQIDILFNGAGGMRTPEGLYYEKPIEEITEDILDEVFRNNLKSAFFMCKAVGPTMLKQGKGSIINVSSGSGHRPEPRRIPYGVSKSGITSFTQSLAAEWGPRGVRVNEILPMAVTRSQEERYQDPENVQRIVGRSMIRRLGKPEDHVGIAIFLASDASEWACGASFRVDGGRM